jgi:hypothetical protein
LRLRRRGDANQAGEADRLLEDDTTILLPAIL